MTMRVHEIHPMLVHFPLALLPTSVAADVVGAMTDDQSLMETGRWLMPLAVASMAATGIAGFAAQEAVHAEGEAHDMLVTHRNLNVGLLLMAAGLAVARTRQRRPGAGYLLAGLAGAALMTYSGYLGGKIVYRHGVGVGAAGGFDLERSPRIESGQFGHAAQAASSGAAQGLAHAAREAARGELAPTLGDASRESGESGPATEAAAGDAAEGLARAAREAAQGALAPAPGNVDRESGQIGKAAPGEAAQGSARAAREAAQGALAPAPEDTGRG